MRLQILTSLIEIYYMPIERIMSESINSKITTTQIFLQAITETDFGFARLCIVAFTPKRRNLYDTSIEVVLYQSAHPPTRPSAIVLVGERFGTVRLQYSYHSEVVLYQSAHPPRQ